MTDLERGHPMARETGFPQIITQRPVTEGTQKECGKHPIQILDRICTEFLCIFFTYLCGQGKKKNTGSSASFF